MGPSGPDVTPTPKLTVRLPASTIERLDRLAAERGLTRSQLARSALEALLAGEPLPEIEAPSETELLKLLAEKARAGNVAAIRSLLVRVEDRDPHQRALAMLQAMAEERRQ
jgi:Ribbon-helix-helix protein, copG family